MAHIGSGTQIVGGRAYGSAMSEIGLLERARRYREKGRDGLHRWRSDGLVRLEFDLCRASEAELVVQLLEPESVAVDIVDARVVVLTRCPDGVNRVGAEREGSRLQRLLAEAQVFCRRVESYPEGRRELSTAFRSPEAADRTCAASVADAERAPSRLENTARPAFTRGRVTYPAPSARMARTAVAFLAAGVALVCGLLPMLDLSWPVEGTVWRHLTSGDLLAAIVAVFWAIVVGVALLLVPRLRAVPVAWFMAAAFPLLLGFMTGLTVQVSLPPRRFALLLALVLAYIVISSAIVRAIREVGYVVGARIIAFLALLGPFLGGVVGAREVLVRAYLAGMRVPADVIAIDLAATDLAGMVLSIELLTIVTGFLLVSLLVWSAGGVLSKTLRVHLAVVIGVMGLVDAAAVTVDRAAELGEQARAGIVQPRNSLARLVCAPDAETGQAATGPATQRSLYVFIGSSAGAHLRVGPVREVHAGSSDGLPVVAEPDAVTVSYPAPDNGFVCAP